MIIQTFRPAENCWAVGGRNLPSQQFMGATGGLPSIYRHFATCELCGERTQQARNIRGPKSRFTRNILTNPAELGIWRPTLPTRVQPPALHPVPNRPGLVGRHQWHKDGTLCLATVNSRNNAQSVIRLSSFATADPGPACLAGDEFVSEIAPPILPTPSPPACRRRRQAGGEGYRFDRDLADKTRSPTARGGWGRSETVEVSGSLDKNATHSLGRLILSYGDVNVNGIGERLGSLVSAPMLEGGLQVSHCVDDNRAAELHGNAVLHTM